MAKCVEDGKGQEEKAEHTRYRMNERTSKQCSFTLRGAEVGCISKPK